MLLPYNFQNPPEQRRALPLREIAQGPAVPVLSNCREVVVSIRAAGDRAIRIRLVTDSPHLALFFEENWAKALPRAIPDATIVALREGAKHVGLDDSFDNVRTYVRRLNTVYMFGNEFYGNIKITVRGLCTALSRQDELFVHGCVLDLNGSGIILCGASGAGKTTVTAALFARANMSVRVVNDDWGCVSTRTGVSYNTHEAALHMKYSSVSTLGTVQHGSLNCLSENYDPMEPNPYARLLIRPEDAFAGSVVDQAQIARFVMVSRKPGCGARLQPFSEPDWRTLKRGTYAAFYDRTEHFMNGSLFNTSSDDLLRYESQFSALRRNVPFFSLTNGGAPEDAADLLLEMMAG